MSTIQMPTPRMTPTRAWKPIYAGVDPQHRWASIFQQSKGLQDVERMGIREILCEMLVASVWEDGDGRVRKEGNSRVEDHHVTTRA
jgi:hypothetical protein